jgi:hypothetical protein
MLNKEDYFEAGKPKHRTSYCAFLDVLGFSERIRQSFKNGKGDELLQEFHALLKRQINAIEKDTNESLLYFRSLTDNIILAHPQFSDDLESEFAFILWSISEYQFAMAQHGFFIRGGLSIGPLFVDGNSVYGPALVQAYELESKFAVNPIVILCDDVKQLVLSHLRYYGNKQQSPQNRTVLINADGRFFINYLAECYLDDGSEEIDWGALHIHKERVEAALTEHRASLAIFAKFSWLAAYHNYFCDLVQTYPRYDPNLRISTAVSTMKFREIVSLLPEVS